MSSERPEIDALAADADAAKSELKSLFSELFANDLMATISKSNEELNTSVKKLVSLKRQLIELVNLKSHLPDRDQREEELDTVKGWQAEIQALTAAITKQNELEDVGRADRESIAKTRQEDEARYQAALRSSLDDISAELLSVKAECTAELQASQARSLELTRAHEEAQTLLQSVQGQLTVQAGALERQRASADEALESHLNRLANRQRGWLIGVVVVNVLVVAAAVGLSLL